MAEQTTTYAPVSDNEINSQNTVTDPAGNTTVYTFSDPIALPWDKVTAVETSRTLYDSSGNKLKTVITHYVSTINLQPAGNPGACQNLSTVQAFDGAIDLPTLPADQETTLDNGETSEIQWTYNCQSLGYGPTELVDKKEYDYGSGAHGPLLRETKYDWLQLDSNADYYLPPDLPPNASDGLGDNILDRKTGETVYDGSGKKVEQTTWQYDNNAPGPDLGAPGVLTQVSHWSNTNGTLTTTYKPTYSGGAFTGYTATYPNGTVVTYNFADNYVGGISPISPSNPIYSNGNIVSSGYPYNAYPTTITTTANGKSYVEQRQYYWGGGLVAAECGYNYSGTCATGKSGVPDYAAYTYDLFGRQTSVSTGDGGYTSTCYSDDPGAGCASIGGARTAVTTEQIQPGVQKVSTSVAMYAGPTGLPTTTTELNSDPSCPGGSVNVDTTYDPDGRKYTVSNPYCTNNPDASTSGTTTYSYDGLSRVTEVLNPDGTYSTNTYAGRAVLSADEGSSNQSGINRIERISQKDALGRLTAVCEIWNGGTTLQGATTTPSSCGLDYPGTGFLTTYGYDASGSYGPLDNVTSVTQGNESRSFIYDSMGNLRSATNPESGTTSYTSYDNESNLLRKADARGITTTYTYDGLNRLTSKTYSDGTPSACFLYDATNVYYSGNAHLMGRLGSEWVQTGACSSPWTIARDFAYDLMGRVSWDEQWLQGDPVFSWNYEYNLAGNVSSEPGAGGSVSLNYNSADQLSSIAAPIDATDGGTFNLFTANSYSPAGAIASAQIGPGTALSGSSQIGAGISLSRTYNNRLLPTSETDTVNSLGTGTVQVYGDEESATQGTETITIGGSEQSTPENGSTFYESGNLVVSIDGGEPLMVSYGEGSTPRTIATAFASQWSGSCAAGTPITASASGTVISITDCESASITVSAYFTTNFPTAGFSAATGSSSGSTVYDTGTVTLTVNGTQVATATYGENSTVASIGSALASSGSGNSVVALSTDDYGNLTMTAFGSGTTTDYSYTLNVVSNNPAEFSPPSFSGESGTLGGGTTVPIYSWAINSYSPGCTLCYAPDGDVLGVTDSVMGTWQCGDPSAGVPGYDSMNRLVQATATSGLDQGMTLNWAYDIYGNRWSQTATGTGGGSATQVSFTFTGNNNRIDGDTYDADGNLLSDGLNTYTYDAENRISSVNGETGYAYDAEGNRVGKFSGTAWNDTTYLNSIYILTPDNKKLADMDGEEDLQYVNIYAPGGRLLATYGSQPGSGGYTYNLTDWLGTKRVQVSASGDAVENCLSNPFGDGLYCYALVGEAADSTEQHFTGKDHDMESGLDYFYARYYSEMLGRFMTPDWAGKPTAVPYADYGDPQSLNLYAYVRNNPLTGIDLDGHVDPPQANPQKPAPNAGTPGTNKTPGKAPPPKAPGGGSAQQQTPKGQGSNTNSSNSQKPATTNSGCPPGTTPTAQKMLVTAYDNSHQSTGKNPGDPGYGVTASGKTAAPGTVAAPSNYPFGTIMIIPGYGTGTVQDRGGAIKNYHIDLWFPTTKQALQWGAQNITVTICLPQRAQ